MAAVIESTISIAVYTQALYLCAELLLIFERYCIISSCCIFTAIDNNFDLFCYTISNNGSGCQIVVIIMSI
jgi:hypothetical protein